MAYTTLSDVREYLGLDVADTGDDTLLGNFIVQAQAFIDHYCRRSFESVTETRYYDAIEDVVDGMLILDKDLLTITTLTVNGSTIASTAYTLLPRNMSPQAAITLKPSSGKTWAYTTDSEDAISIAGTWGYSTSAPSDIVYAIIRLVAYFYRKKDAQVFEDTAFAQAGVVTVPKGTPKDVLDILNQYRRRRILS